MAGSQFGKFVVDQKGFNDMFGVVGYNLNTTSVAPYVKLFQEKLGANKPLKLTVGFKDLAVTFGRFESDIILDYSVCFDVQLALYGSKPMMSDCLRLQTSILAQTQNDIWHIDLLEHKVNLDAPGANREAPAHDALGITANEYREFLEDFSFTCEEFKNWLNSVVLRGNRVRFPFHPTELQSSVKFEDQKMHIMFEPEDTFYKLLEDNFW